MCVCSQSASSHFTIFIIQDVQYSKEKNWLLLKLRSDTKNNQSTFARPPNWHGPCYSLQKSLACTGPLQRTAELISSHWLIHQTWWNDALTVGVLFLFWHQRSAHYIDWYDGFCTVPRLLQSHRYKLFLDTIFLISPFSFLSLWIKSALTLCHPSLHSR